MVASCVGIGVTASGVRAECAQLCDSQDFRGNLVQRKFASILSVRYTRVSLHLMDMRWEVPPCAIQRDRSEAPQSSSPKHERSNVLPGGIVLPQGGWRSHEQQNAIRIQRRSQRFARLPLRITKKTMDRKISRAMCRQTENELKRFECI